jgi:hypothetical protein
MTRVSAIASLRCRAWLVVTLLLGSGRAEAGALALEWTAPPECPAAAEVEARIRSLAGDALDVAARVHVARTVDGYRADLVLRGRDGTARERSLTGESCQVVVEAVATVLVASHVEEQAAAPRPPPARPDTPSPRLEASPPPPISSGWDVWVAARPMLDAGLLPATVLGGVVDVGAGLGDWRGELRLAGLAPADAVAPAGSSAELFAFTAEGAACAARALATIRVGGCIGFGVALVHGRGVGVAEPRSELRLVPAPKLAVDLRWPARGRIALRGDATVRLALTRPEFSIENEGPLHRPALLSGQLALGPEARF